MPEPQNPHELKVKFKSLSAESKIIRQEEAKQMRFARKLAKSKTKPQNWEQYHSIHLLRWADLGHHRDGLRVEARSTHLTRMFLRGTAYVAAEARRTSAPNWADMERMILKYGVGDQRVLKQAFEQWKQTGEDLVWDYRKRPKPQRAKRAARTPEEIAVQKQRWHDMHTMEGSLHVAPRPDTHPAGHTMDEVVHPHET